jgi:hypothetical protein
MHQLSAEFVAREPACLQARDSLDLLIALSEHDTVTSLADLLWMTAHAERAYARLSRFRHQHTAAPQG